MENRLGYIGASITGTLGAISTLTANQVLTYVSIAVGIATLGYTVTKWILLFKHKTGKEENL